MRTKSKFIVQPLNADHDQRQNPRTQGAEDTSRAVGKGSKATKADHPPKAGAWPSSHQGEEEGGPGYRTQAKAPKGRGRKAKQQDPEDCTEEDGEITEAQKYPFKGNKTSKVTAEESPGDRRKEVNEERRRQLQEARKRAQEVRAERAALKKQEKEMKEAVYLQKRREIEEMKKYLQSKNPPDPPSPKPLKDLKPKLASPFKKGWKPKPPTEPEPRMGRTGSEHLFAHFDLEGENAIDAEDAKPVEEIMPDAREERKTLPQVDFKSDGFKEFTPAEEAELSALDLEAALLKEEEAKLEAQKKEHEKEIALQQKRRQIELENERQRAAYSVYKRRMEENRLRLLSQAIFGN